MYLKLDDTSHQNKKFEKNEQRKKKKKKKRRKIKKKKILKQGKMSEVEHKEPSNSVNDPKTGATSGQTQTNNINFLDAGYDEFLTPDELCNADVLRSLDNSRKLSVCNASDDVLQARNASIVTLLRVSNALSLCDEAISLAIKIFDFYIFQPEKNKNSSKDILEKPELLTATSLLIAAKIEDTKRADFCSNICSNFQNVKESEVLSFELQVLQNLKYNIIFATPIQFLWFSLKELYKQHLENFSVLTHCAKIICICAESSIKSYQFSCEDIANKCVSIAIELNNNGRDIEKIQLPDDDLLKQIIVESIRNLNTQISDILFNGIHPNSS